MEIIDISGYTTEEKVGIARNYLIPRQLSEHGVKTGKVAFTDAAIDLMIMQYTREAGVRNLERRSPTSSGRSRASWRREKRSDSRSPLPTSTNISAFRNSFPKRSRKTMRSAWRPDSPGPRPAAISFESKRP